MKPMTIRSLPAVALVLASACAGAPKETAADKNAPVSRARGDAASLKIVLAVDAVDAEKRLITLRGPGGRSGTFPVSPEVRRLSEIHAGDTILADYRVAAVAELRAPTAEEERVPLVLGEMIDRNPANLPPGGTLARSIRVVTTIDALNATAGTITLTGPLEGQVVATLDDPAALPQLRVGQKVVVTFAETLVLSVQAGAKKD